jgi:8-oxo-dGTP pyrophosphatase MutT (NUDIX family)
VISSAEGGRVERAERIAIRFEPRPWAAAAPHRAAIAEHFGAFTARHPGVWNGRILLSREHALGGGVLTGTCFESDYASYLAWRDGVFSDDAVKNCFGMGIIEASDGAYVLGVMGTHTANAGMAYFPAGTLEPDDLVDGLVDYEGSIRREVEEETGLTPADYAASPDWFVVFAGFRVAMGKLLRAHEPGAALRARILDHLARDTEPELSDILVVRDPADLTAAMPPHMPLFLRYAWAARRRGEGL